MDEEKKCEDCLAHYTGNHVCPPWLKMLVKMHKEKMSAEYDELKKAYEMGVDCRVNGANINNCDFRVFSSPEKTKAWEVGKNDPK